MFFSGSALHFVCILVFIFYHFIPKKGASIMKNAIVKAIVLCTLALSLVVAGVAAVNAGDSGVAVCHDGWVNGEMEW